MPLQANLLYAQVHSKEQSEAAPSASTSREASVLELADLDREVIHQLIHSIHFWVHAMGPFSRVMRQTADGYDLGRVTLQTLSCWQYSAIFCWLTGL